MEEDWSYLSEEKGINFEEAMELHSHGFPRSSKLPIRFDQRPLYGSELNSDREVVRNIAMPLYGSNSGHEIPTFQEDESGSSVSNSFIEFDALLSKRARTTRNVQPICQVYGCNKDLSSSKTYHKRHRVCDVHSKMPRVIVDGVERRFCQQCSRFHPLSEFDGDKRSCRRRLAGHNERRRKSHLLGLTGKSPQLQQSSQGYSAKKSIILSPDGSPCHPLYANASEALTTFGFTTDKMFLEAQGIYGRYGSAYGKTPVFQKLSGVSQSSSSSLSSGASSLALSLLSTQTQDLYQSHASNPNISQSPSCLHPTRHTSVVDTMLFRAPDELMNTDAHHLSERESTVDLFQLSSHLRRVEQQRSSFHIHSYKAYNGEPEYPG